jgi:hypothetical protein
MKKLLLALLVLTTLSAGMASTTPTQDIFVDDLRQIDQQFADLHSVEQFVTTHQLTYDELVTTELSLASTLKTNQDLGSSLLGANAPEERLLDIPGFLWGFCLGLIGAVLVYVAIEDPVAKKREGKQAITGCLVRSLLGTVLYIAYILVVFGSFAALSAG